MSMIDSTPRAIARTVLIVVAVLICLYIIYLLRKPLGWLVIAAFIAVAAAGPVNYFQRHMKRSLAIAVVYLILILIPIGLGALLIPPLVNEIEALAGNAPEYAQDVEDYVQDNETLRNLNEDYDITTKIQDEAAKLPERIPDAAGVLSDIGVGVVNSIFAGVTILILSIFMVAAGPRWLHSFIEAQRPDHAERMERTLRRIANAVGNYVGGALLQATIAGITAFIVLKILGAPFAGPLAVLVFFFDLIPVVGATIAAFLVAIVVAFVNFPIALIIWIVFAIVYQQVENYVIQPQIQKRATKIEPFIVLVAVLFGSTLFGIIGALLAIPTAAAIQISVHEWREYRRSLSVEGGGSASSPPGTAPGPATS
ncbi:MAG TPA: AI-2E family transporter [Solirubrobacterales bacterium]|jgi:predicted PurR-regulated permease PerM|nr:AI-2E family transporter [Solirubrobacterales bacterium]